MNTTVLRICISLAALSLLAITTERAQAQPPAASINVVSFNIRYGTASDGENHWDKRREFLIETIQSMKPDLLGTQETLGFQRDYLAEKLPEFDHLGVGRDDGKEAGEMMALYFRRDRFEKLTSGHFWLSTTPVEVGSKSWDSSLPRMATWVKLRDRKQTDAPNILFINTHYDHRGPTARLESSKLIRRQITELGKDSLVILTGDFNADQQSPPYNALFDSLENQPSPVVDTFRAAHPQREPNEGTFSAFKAGENRGARIDWIGASPQWKIQSAEINRSAKEGRTPSDHFPVTATLIY